MQKFRKIFPNILTFMRIFIIPLAIYLGFSNHYRILALVCVFIALTDYFDGHLARKWHTTSDFGAKLDTVADKSLAFGLLLILLFKNKVYIVIFLLEVLISIVNLYSYAKTKNVESLLIGKFKTWVLFMALILGFVNMFFPKIYVFMSIFTYNAILFQVLTTIFYIRNYLLIKGKKKIL